MVLNRDSFLNSIINSLKSMANHYNRSIVIRERALNKAFGAENCPCLKHLVKDTPYIAVGPNDDHSKVHGSDESISLNHLELIAKQYMKIAEVVSMVEFEEARSTFTSSGFSVLRGVLNTEDLDRIYSATTALKKGAKIQSQQVLFTHTKPPKTRLHFQQS